MKIVWEGCRATVGRRLARRLFRVQGTQKTALMPLAEKKAQQEPQSAIGTVPPVEGLGGASARWKGATIQQRGVMCVMCPVIGKAVEAGVGRAIHALPPLVPALHTRQWSTVRLEWIAGRRRRSVSFPGG